MLHLNSDLIAGFKALYGEWGQHYRILAKAVPLMPEQGAVYFYRNERSPTQVARKLESELGPLRYKHLLTYVLSLRSKDAHVQLAEALGFPAEEHAYFYLEAVYVLVVESWRELEDDPAFLELLACNLISFWAERSVSYFLYFLKVSLEKMLPLLEKLLWHDDSNVRSGVPLFYYGIRCLFVSNPQNYSWVISKPQWQEIQNVLAERLPLETDPEVRGLIEREISSIKAYLDHEK